MARRRGLVVALLLTSLTASACAGDDSEKKSESTASEDVSAEGTSADSGDVPAGDDSPSPEELADLYAVSVPAGTRIVSAEEDTATGIAIFELAYDGDPDVDGYRNAIAQAGWTIDSEGPLASYGWCLRRGLAEVAREVFDRLGIPAGALIAYAVLTSGQVEWWVSSSDRECVVGQGLSATDDQSPPST